MTACVIGRDVKLNCIQCNLGGKKVEATDGLFCHQHARVGSEFRRPAREVFGWSLIDGVKKK